MTSFILKRVLWACTVAALCLSPVAQAELGFFEKIKVKREAARLTAENLPELTEEQDKTMTRASLSGTPTATMAGLLTGIDALAKLDQQATKSGYENFLHYEQQLVTPAS